MIAACSINDQAVDNIIEADATIRVLGPTQGLVGFEDVRSYAILKSLGRCRDVDQSRLLIGHADNIPSITFCNNPSDKQGKYLASTSIDGIVLIWNVDRGYPIRSLSPFYTSGVGE